MKLIVIALLLASCAATLACHHERVYSHDSRHFNDEDRLAVRLVESSPLGKPEVMRQVVDDMLTNSGNGIDAPMDACDYEVVKRVEPHRVLYVVICITRVGDSPEVAYVWDVERGGFGVVGFRWGWAPYD